MILVPPFAAAATGMPGCESRSRARRELEREAERSSRAAAPDARSKERQRNEIEGEAKDWGVIVRQDAQHQGLTHPRTCR